MAEQLTLYQLTRDSGTIDLYHRTVCTRRVLVYQVRHHLFTRSVRTGNQHTSLCRRHLIYYLAHALDSRTLAHHRRTFRGYFLAKLLSLLPQVLGLQGVLRRDQDAVQIQRLDQEVIRTGFESLYSGLHVAVTRNHHNRTVGRFVCVLECREYFHTIHLRHLDIRENQVVSLCLRHLQTLFAVLSHLYFIPLVGKYLAKRVTYPALVVYN